MPKTKIAVVSLGDMRLNFYNSRKNIADQETEKLVAELSKYYEVYAPDVVFTINDALKTADEIRSRLIVQVIVHIPIWCTPNLVLRIANSTPYPVILFGNERKDSSSTVAILACAGLLNQVGKEHKRIIGDITGPDVLKKVQDEINAIGVADGLKRSSFGMIGGRSIGIGTTVADPNQWQRLFGTEFDHCDQYEIVYRAKALDEETVERHMKWVKEHFTIFYNPTFDERRLELQVRSYLALRDMAKENCYDFMGVKCQPDMSDHFVLQCLGSGGLPTCLEDIKYFSSEEKEMILANCGALAPYFADRSNPDAAMKKTHLMHHVFGEAGGGSLQMVASSGDITCARMIRNSGRYTLVCFEGRSVEKDREELRKINYSYPTQFLEADIDYDKFFETMNANHFHTVYGKYAAVLEEFCHIVGIDYLCYNV